MKKHTLLIVTVFCVWSAAAHAATYYIGNFTGSTPADDLTCGLAVSGSGHPCLTLAYWNQNRRATLLASCSSGSPCTVRLAPGTYNQSGQYQCVLAQSNVTYEGRLADDSGLPPDFNAVVIDASTTTQGSAPCRGRSMIPVGASGTYPDTAAGNISGFTVRYLTLEHSVYDSTEYHFGAALYAGSSGAPSVDVTVDHVRVTGNHCGGLQLGDLNWRQSQCSSSKAFCSSSLIGSACAGGAGTCTMGLDWDCQATGRRLGDGTATRVQVIDSQFDGNDTGCSSGGSYGLGVGCVDGFTVARSAFFNNRTAGNCLGGGGMNGLGINGGAHGDIYGNSIFDNGEGELEVGSTINYAARDNIVERNQVWTTCTTPNVVHAGVKFVGGLRNTFRNNFVVGALAPAVQMYNCDYGATFQNNTIVATGSPSYYALLIGSSIPQAGFENNIWNDSWSSSGVGQVTRRAVNDAGVAWDYNVLWSALSGGLGWEIRSDIPATGFCTCTAANAVADCGSGGVCDSSEYNHCEAGTRATCSQNADCLGSSSGVCTANVCTAGMIGQPCTVNGDCNQVCLGEIGKCLPLQIHGLTSFTNRSPTSPGNLDDTPGALTTFRSTYFGGGKGAHDKWGTSPTFVSFGNPSAANLHLQSTDTVAKAAAANLSATFADDYDGQGRATVWDIGADQISPTPTPSRPNPARITSVEFVSP